MAQQANNLSLDALTEGKNINGFRAEALYLNDADKAFGARFRHQRTGFTLDFLELQSVPQALMWVNSFPTSDRGEPHTQEHLLLGKGNAGRAHSSLEDMSLAGSTAFTMQWRTVYQLHTAAGPEVFYKLFESQTDSLLHPDYTDEEIRREVSHWGINENPADKSLRLEEKGMPGLGVMARDVEGGIYYVIGPEKQLSAYEEYLETVEGPGMRLYKIYPRDYWMPLKV